MPTFANVRRSPEVTPKALVGATFMTAELFDGKKQPMPMALTDVRDDDDPERRVHAELGVGEEGEDLQDEAEGRRQHRAVAVGEASGERSEGATDHVARHQEQRRANRVEVMDALEIHQEQKEDREVREALDHGGEERRRDRRDLEEIEVEQRLFGVTFDLPERQQGTPRRRRKSR